MRVEIPSGDLEIDTEPPIRFVAKCSDVPFQQEHLLISAMEDLVKKNAELMRLPGEDFRLCQNTMMRRGEVRDRLATFVELNSRYAQCTIKLEAAALILDDRRRMTEEYNQEVLMNRISNIIDKITTSFIRDNANRKRAKKVTFPLPKLNTRATTFTSIGQVRELQEALKDEIRSIEQVAFKPEDPNEDEARVVVEGDDIPDTTEERQPQRVRSQQSTTTRPTDRPRVDFEERRNVLDEVRNITNNENRTNMVNIRPDRPDQLDNHSSDSSDAESVGHWDTNWAEQRCHACGKCGHTSWSCKKKARGELFCHKCKKNTHVDATCYARRSSTPRFPHNQYPSPHTTDNFAVPPVETNFTTRPSLTPSNAGNIADLTQMFVTHLNENRAQNHLSEHQKELLANIPIFDGKDRKACLMWINQLEHAAAQEQITLKKVIAAKAEPIVTSTVQSLLSKEPDANDAKVKQVILESFSNIGTKTKAFHELKDLKLDNNESLLAHNAEYAAIHEAAYGIPPERQTLTHVFLDYSKSLPEFTSELLTRKIVRDDTKIQTLRQAMDEAEKIHKQARQEEITKLERSAMRDTVISSRKSVNELSMTKDVNFMPPGRPDNHFNSTMKNNGGCQNNFSKGRNNSYYYNNSRNNSYSDGNSRNSSYSDSKNWDSRHNYSSNYNSRRKLRRYSHQPRDPKSKVQFEYNIHDRSMMKNLRRAVDSLKDEPQSNRNRFKQIAPRMSHRSQEEVREDAIAKIKIQEIQEILKEDLDLIFDVLVVQDYIDEVSA